MPNTKQKTRWLPEALSRRLPLHLCRLDACAPHAKWIDVFCERGAFDGDQSRAVLSAGVARGLRPRVHANQLGPGPGVQIAVEYDAA